MGQSLGDVDRFSIESLRSSASPDIGLDRVVNKTEISSLRAIALKKWTVRRIDI
jgi:hypothetical protein